MSYLLVFIGGGLGSITRFAFSNYFGTLSNAFPLATFLSNTISSLILGVAVSALYAKSAGSQSALYLLLFVTAGFCGGFSTFSTFSLETFRLISNGNHTMALINVLANVLLCYVAIATGMYAGKQFQ